MMGHSMRALRRMHTRVQEFLGSLSMRRIRVLFLARCQSTTRSFSDVSEPSGCEVPMP